MIANTRGPASFPELAAEVAPTVRATTVDEAKEADVLFLAIPFLAAGPFGASRSRWDGKIIVDVTNTLSLPNAAEALAGRPSTEIVAEQLGYAPVELGRVDEGGRLIQAPNALVLRYFLERPMS
jgi:8-hydroxy-5-deazaflavin:NADPH oxidoreductase